MSSPRVQWFLVCLALLIVGCNPALADDSEAPAAQGPYFHINSADPAVDRLPLKSTRASVRIAGVIADVTITQRYRNEGTKPIEARYVFPGSTQASVHALSVRIGDRLINATIREKQQARIEYAQAKTEGRTAALLEQERPNVFSMNVANILPGDNVDVELHYTELIAPVDRRYQFVFPTVVGPRYVASGAGFPGSPHLHAGEPSNTAFDLDLRIDSPLPVSDIESSSHAIDVRGAGSRRATVQLREREPSNNRDFILSYRLAGDRTATGLMLYKGAKENFFLALVEPPKFIKPAAINPREYIFVVDISGSMHGYPLDTAKELLRKLIGGLRSTDTFNVMLFSGSNSLLHETSVPATAANIEQAMRVIDRQYGGGSTEIVPALRRIAELPKPAQQSRTVIVVTDGYVAVENEVFALVRRNLGNANLFAFGIGSAVNRHLIEGLARAGQGEPFIVTRPGEAAAQTERLRKMIDSPVLTQLRARFEGMEAYDVEPQVLPDVLGGRPVVIMGKWRDDATKHNAVRMVLAGQQADGAWSETVRAPAPDDDAVALQMLWARSRIRQLSDEEALTGGGDQREAITSLGLQYGLLTQYTSFIAVDRFVRTSTAATTVDQPSPMPAGVTDSAIGAEVPSTPEPATWLALLVALTALAALPLWRRRVALTGGTLAGRARTGDK
ncbi:MAG TPA: VIT and VWA domain-containing protein [Steroidobacteraceae bacterium]|nr:VIT and VWA domain-containing protein [Steroidobacteraceae bacterium]